jgi:hypothetical protein
LYAYPSVCGTVMLTPPATATSHSRSTSDWQARCTAVSELEHAVCTVIAGPCRSSRYATRVARKSLSLPMSTGYGIPLPRYSSLASTLLNRYELSAVEP